MGRARAAVCLAGALSAFVPAAAAAAPAGARPSDVAVGALHTVTATEGAVTAKLTYVDSAGAPAGLRLTIERAGSTVYDAPVKSGHCSPCGLERFGGGPLLVRDLEGNGQPSVIIELYTGGAHCCTILQVFGYDSATRTYRRAERDFGDPGATIADVAGNRTLQLLTADDRFAYAFAPFAYSGLPLQVLAFRNGRFANVTSSYPAALTKDAAKWLGVFRSERRLQLGNGAIAAWAADEELLGHDALVRATLAREARHERLRSREHYGPSNDSFVRALLRFLRHTGYRH